ncbi:MAG: RNA polymerase sigma factor [Actinomycetota bacterium]|nr:RNA polymerase sigma factor [Actinomycetota bacterium]
MSVIQQRLAEDLESSFVEVVRAYQDAVFSIVLGIVGNREDAEEVTQDALVRAFKALRGYERQRIFELRLRPWLVQIAVNLARNRLRRRRPTVVSLDDVVHEPVSTQFEPHDHAERREEKGELAKMLAELPVGYRVAVVLRHVEGLTYEEISEVLHKPVGTVKVHVHRGLIALQRLVESDEREVLVR